MEAPLDVENRISESKSRPRKTFRAATARLYLRLVISDALEQQIIRFSPPQD